jgi:hypothetical protein
MEPVLDYSPSATTTTTTAIKTRLQQTLIYKSTVVVRSALFLCMNAFVFLL